MAFRRQAFLLLGGFDERLDVGAAGCGGDSELWYNLLSRGKSCRYEPSAVVFHTHRRDWKDLESQIFHYMRGHVSALLIQFEKHRHWGNLRRLFISLPWSWARLFLSGCMRGFSLRHRFLWQELTGSLSGLWVLFDAASSAWSQPGRRNALGVSRNSLSSSSQSSGFDSQPIPNALPGSRRCDHSLRACLTFHRNDADAGTNPIFILAAIGRFHLGASLLTRTPLHFAWVFPISEPTLRFRKKMKTLLVTGSNGLIGSEMVKHFHSLGWTVRGVDNNMRADFFGSQGDTRWNQDRLARECNRFTHHELDMRNRQEVLDLFRELRPQAVIHAAAQPSHDLAAQRPFDDFDVNASGTLNLLEGMRRYCPEAPLVHFSSNKVYGDAPNRIRLKELASRWDYAGSRVCGRHRRDFHY